MNEPTVIVGDREMPLTCANTIIVGAGAAGMNCAVQLVRFWRARGVEAPQDRVLVVTAGLGLGASRMSGSDKQTYYKMGTSPRVADTAEDFARTLTAFGCCDGDTALVEGGCSLRAFYNLVEAGVPFPHDPYGAFVGYKTDHDPSERATSAGPKTSRFMSHRLQDEVERLGIRILDRHPVIEFIREGDGDDARIVGMLCFDRSAGDGAGLHAFAAKHWVLAAGGPGEIYARTVYPPHQRGLHGAALAAGLEACNLTESQFGLASTKFRWNVSGTYMQVIPRIYSTAADGRSEPRDFLNDYFPDMETMATAIFLKGYQWPFDSQRIIGHGSSLIDMAVHQETVVRRRRVWMDFLGNPAGTDDGDEFHISKLGDEAVEYLEATGALQSTPIERLEHMNAPAIEIYAENGIDLRCEPLEIAVCAQHANGGFAVDAWWRSTVPGVFVIGEMAGTHGVKRPGGAALNAGQVGAMRAAEYIAGACRPEQPDAADSGKRLVQGARKTPAGAAAGLWGGSEGAADAPTAEQVMDDIRQRMTRYGAQLRWRDGADGALSDAVAQYRRLVERGVRTGSRGDRVDAVAALQQCLTHAAILKAVCAMFERGAGSRGSHCILDESGTEMHPYLIDPATDRPYRFVEENEALRDEILRLRYDPDAADLFGVWAVSPRQIPVYDEAFEPTWTAYREDRIF
ncbi:MAG: FAD-binding protein [Planctomycetota bacterium]